MSIDGLTFVFEIYSKRDDGGIHTHSTDKSDSHTLPQPIVDLMKEKRDSMSPAAIVELIKVQFPQYNYSVMKLKKRIGSIPNHGGGAG